MELQYLVGLCCLRRHPAAVEIILGDMVHDAAAEKPRDVDVTIKLTGYDGAISAFKGFEVKQEGKPLDVTTVEQLAAKLRDMPDVTHRAVVSSSGYTSGAIKKAAHHGVELYQFEAWNGSISETLPHWDNPLSPQEAMSFSQWLLYWEEAAQIDLVVPWGTDGFRVAGDTPLFSDEANVHSRYPSFGVYQAELLLRSTGLLCRLEPAISLLRLPPAETDRARLVCRSTKWPHTHTMDVVADGVFLELDGRQGQLTQVTISGRLYWESVYQQPEYTVLRRVDNGDVFASAVIAPGRTKGELLCWVFDPTSPRTGVHFVRLTEQQQRILRRVGLVEADKE